MVRNQCLLLLLKRQNSVMCQQQWCEQTDFMYETTRNKSLILTSDIFQTYLLLLQNWSHKTLKERSFVSIFVDFFELNRSYIKKC